MRYLKTFIRIVRTIKSRPNRYFALLVITIIGLFMLAYMHNYNIVYLMMFFTFAFAAASSLMGRLNLDAITAGLLSHGRFFAATPSQCKVALHNAELRVVYAAECSLGEATNLIQRIDPGESAIAGFDVTFDQRGEMRLPDLKLASHFPLPHEQFYTFLPLHEEVLVYPEPKGIALEEYFAQNPSAVGERDDFEGLRPYEQGDQVSLIHWPSIARGTELMSKQFSHTLESAEVCFDFQSCGRDDEERLSQLCLWVLECEKKKIPFSITIPDRQLQSKKMTTDEILGILARY